MDRIHGIRRHLEPIQRRKITTKNIIVPNNTSNSQKKRLDQKVAFISGAASGIGRSSCLLFLEEGATVYCVDYNAEGLETTIKLARDRGFDQTQCEKRVVDVSQESQVTEAIADCVAKFGGLDICFANAGVIGMPVPFVALDADSITRVLDVNIKGVLFCFKHASLHMLETERKGALMATASVAGVRSGAGDTVYSATKAAVISICQTVANQLTSTGIRCNSISPGLIETGMTRYVFEMADGRGKRHKIGQINPMLRYGEAIEIAKVALFLASADSSYVNGQNLCVDGGLSSSHPVAKRGKFLFS